MAGSGDPLARPITILAIPGSLRAASLNRMVVDSLQGLAPDGMRVKVYLGAGDLPLYNEDFDTATPPAQVQALRAEIAAADGLFWAMPEFNHTIPSVVKNLIEWVSHPVSDALLVGKISAIAVATQGRGGYRGMADLSRVLRDLGGHVVVAPEVCIHFAHTCISRDEAGHVQYRDPLTERLLRMLLEYLTRAARNDVGVHTAAPWRAIFARTEAPG